MTQTSSTSSAAATLASLFGSTGQAAAARQGVTGNGGQGMLQQDARDWRASWREANQPRERSGVAREVDARGAGGNARASSAESKSGSKTESASGGRPEKGHVDRTRGGERAAREASGEVKEEAELSSEETDEQRGEHVMEDGSLVVMATQHQPLRVGKDVATESADGLATVQQMIPGQRLHGLMAMEQKGNGTPEPQAAGQMAGALQAAAAAADGEGSSSSGEQAGGHMKSGQQQLAASGESDQALIQVGAGPETQTADMDMQVQTSGRQSHAMTQQVEAVNVAAAPSAGVKVDAAGALPAGLAQLTGEAEPEVDANVTRIAQGLRSAVNLRNGAVTINLNPAELGSVRIEMEVKYGAVSASLQTQHASVRDLLSHQLGHLREALQGRGLMVERLEVQQQVSPQEHAGLDGQQAHDQGRSRGQFFQQREGAPQHHGEQQRGGGQRRSFGDVFVDMVG